MRRGGWRLLWGISSNWPHRTILSWAWVFWSVSILQKCTLFFTLIMDNNSEENWAALHYQICHETWKNSFRNLRNAKNRLWGSFFAASQSFWVDKAFRDEREAIEDARWSSTLSNLWKCGCYLGCSGSGPTFKCHTNCKWGRITKSGDSSNHSVTQHWGFCEHALILPTCGSFSMTMRWVIHH